MKGLDASAAEEVLVHFDRQIRHALRLAQKSCCTIAVLQRDTKVGRVRPKSLMRAAADSGSAHRCSCFKARSIAILTNTLRPRGFGELVEFRDESIVQLYVHARGRSLAQRHPSADAG